MIEYMMCYKLMSLIVALMVATISWGQIWMEPLHTTGKTSFAIVADLTTWQKCQAEILRYRDVLEAEQLPSYIVADRWKHPEQLREILLKLYNEQHLEGAVFIGDIPIPMIRKAQHMTSAFKMDEKKYPMIRSSVPSDRFYDDFDLKFDFLKQDSLNPLMFYYNLSAVSPQDIRCDIYTGRIKPVISEGLDKYQQIRDYLSKAVAAHQEANRLDQFVSYTGEGSYSNSLTAWRAEQQTLREQLPGVFDRKNNARFMRYSMWDYPKDDVITALKREDLDMMIFHEHGLPHRQYLSAVPSTHDYEQHMEILKREVRLKLRQDAEDGKDFRKRMCKWSEDFQVDTSWWTGITDTQMIRQDSLVNVHMGIVLEDVSRNKKAVLLGATLGPKVDLLLRKYSIGDMARVVTLQACAAAMLEEYLDEWQTALEADMKKEGYYIRPRFSPGYGDFDIAHQDMILRMLDTAKKIGLTLTGGNMLTPSKSVTAVIGLSETETSCHIKGCEVCQKKDCAYRRS